MQKRQKPNSKKKKNSRASSSLETAWRDRFCSGTSDICSKWPCAASAATEGPHWQCNSRSLLCASSQPHSQEYCGPCFLFFSHFLFHCSFFSFGSSARSPMVPSCSCSQLISLSRNCFICWTSKATFASTPSASAMLLTGTQRGQLRHSEAQKGYVYKYVYIYNSDTDT